MRFGRTHPKAVWRRARASPSCSVALEPPELYLRILMGEEDD